MSVNAVSVENGLIADGEDSQRNIRQHAENWIEANRDTFDGWLEEARAAAM